MILEYFSIEISYFLYRYFALASYAEYLRQALKSFK